MSAPPPNFQSQTIWTADNLDVMRGMNSACVDLIYLDPPFNSGQQWSAPIGSEAAGAEFKDAWTLSDINIAEQGIIRKEHKALHAIIKAAGKVHSPSMRSYLIYMGVRLVEMKRILKPTGSIYLHCDDTAGAWLKTAMDAVFGKDCFRNEITWKRTSSRSDAKRFGRVSDRLLYYIKGDAKPTWNGAWMPHDPAYVAKFYRHDDGDGRGLYRKDNIQSPNPRPNLMYEWKGYPSPPMGWRYERETMARLDAEGRIWYPGDKTKRPQVKRYLNEQKGRAAVDVITDIDPAAAHAKERIGYPTQKPLPLLRRVIEASSNEGDLVLDPFCGCATACVAAEQLERQWAGIDVSPKAAELVRSRLRREVGMFWQGAHREDVPQRTDLGPIPAYNSKENRERLYGRQGGYCNGCQTHFTPRNLAVDHIVPQSKGGGHHIDNLQLLCTACNSAKGSGSHAALIAKLVDEGIRR